MPTSIPFPEQPPSTLSVNSRYVNIAPDGQYNYAEYIATNITLVYEPTSGSSRAVFQGRLHYKPADKYLAISHPNGSQEDILSVELNGKRSELLVPPQIELLDPVTGIDLRQVSVGGVELLLKFGYNKFHNEKALATAQQTWQLEADQRQQAADKAEQERQIQEAGGNPNAPQPTQAGYDAFAEEEIVVSNTEDPEGP